MKIKAIETVYKGYRFRSRLEARWAVMFEEHGTQWEYEKEGYELPSGRYLPDFYLPTCNMFVEVKPPPTPQVVTPIVYMAGRMVKACWRPIDSSIEYYYHSQPNRPYAVYRQWDGFQFKYSGPFRTNHDDHGWVHGIDDCFSEEPNIVDRSFAGVACCNVFFALFEDMEAFGTLVELGAAKSLNKKIVVGFTSSSTDPHCGILTRENPLWFAAQCADHVLCGSRQQILESFHSWLLSSYSPPREWRLARDLVVATGKTVSIVYGDPVAAFEDGCAGVVQFNPEATREFGWGRPMFECWSYQERDAAALTARQARFEHGEAGAPA